jgi:hypothetical protein
MKKRFIFTMILLLLFSYNSISANEYHKEINTIECLLNERIKIINGFLYGYKDMDRLKEKLNKIESGNLLENDLDILYKVIDCPTDYELAMNVKVHKINSIEMISDGYYVNADLNWLMRGYDGEFNLIKNYDIKCIEQDEQIYIAKLMILNDN